MKPFSRQQFTDLVVRARVKLRLQRELRYVPEEIRDWEERDFLAVMNKSRTEGVLIVPFIDRVIAFELRSLKARANGALPAAVICDFCATWQRSTRAATITFSKDKRSLTFLVCADLNCSLHVRDKTEEARVSRTQLREDITEEGRVERLLRRMTEILQAI